MDNETGTATGAEAEAELETGEDTTTIPLFQPEESPLPEFQDPHTTQNQSPKSAPVITIPEGRVIVASAPVRVDLAGGWSDTPPICYETEGAVSKILLFIPLSSLLSLLFSSECVLSPSQKLEVLVFDITFSSDCSRK
jgi:hypothetical protein